MSPEDIEHAAFDRLVTKERLDLVLSHLSPRQIEVLRLLLYGETHEEISLEIGLPTERIDQIVAKIRSKAATVRETHPSLFE